eukprot:15113300-Ditylum_brightwellii.AAC.1
MPQSAQKIGIWCNTSKMSRAVCTQYLQARYICKGVLKPSQDCTEMNPNMGLMGLARQQPDHE